MADSDLAKLGFIVDTNGLTKGEKGLNKYAATGEKTERRMGSSVNSMNKDFMSLKSSIGLVAVSLAALKISNDVISSHIAFGSAISQLSAITGAVGKDLEFYKEQSIAIGASTTLSATQAANAFKLIASAKPDLLSSSEALASVTHEAVILAEAAGVELPQAAQALGSSLNQFQLSAGSASEVINILAASSKLGTASIQLVNESLVNAGSAANSLGIDLADTVAGIQALAKAGIVGAEGGTAFRQVLLKLEKTANKDLMPSIVGVTTSIENLSKMNLDNLQLMKLFGEEAFKSAVAIIAQKDTLLDLSSSLRGTSVAYEQARINQDNLGGDLKKLTSIIETLSLTAGSNLDKSLRSVTQTTTGLLGQIDALTSSAEAFISVVGVGVAAAISKATAATSLQIAADISSVTASKAAGVARATVAESYAASAAVMSASELSLSTERVAATKFTISQLVAELNLEKQRFAAQISQTGRTASFTRMAEIQVASLAITKQLTAAEAQLAVAHVVAAEATAAQTAAATGLAAAEGVATGAAYALGAATRFLLGPWGLLITAIGVAATVFITTGDDSDTLTSFLKEQNGTVGDLESSYKRLSNAQIGSAYLEAQKVLIGYESERLKLIAKIDEASEKKDRGSVQRTRNLSIQLLSLDKSMAAPQKRLDAINKLIEDGFDSAKWVDPVAEAAAKAAKVKKDELIANAKALKSYDNTMDALDLLSKQQTLSANDYELYAAKIKSIDSGMSAEQITAIQDRIKAIQEERDTIAANTSYQDWIDSITSDTKIGKLQALQEEITEVYMAMDGGDVDESIGEQKLKLLEDQVDDINSVIATIGEDAANPFDQMVTGANQALEAMSGMFESGSKDAQKLAVAMSALNLISAVQAVLTQGEGDPYTAFGRMAAMAGMVASLGVQIGSLGGGFTDTAAQNQATQGVGEWGEKSESIANSIDLTANATDKLVGINTSMLDALVTMQQGISAAAKVSIQGLDGLDFGTTGQDAVVSNVYAEYSNDLNLNDKANQAYGGIMGEEIGGIIKSAFTIIPMAIGKLLGGSSSVTDTGIKILGGTMSDIINGAVVTAYSVTSAKKFAWQSSHDYFNEAVIDGASAQFSLVFASLADSVYQGGLALGMSGAALEDSINKFVLETTQISLKDLSSEGQAAEIEAVFSKLFDDLTLSVIPMVSDFQQMGEGLGETLARISTEVAIADYSIKNLGINLGDKLANPELFVQIADNLTNLTGGIEDFADKVSSFVDDFAPDSVKFTMYSDALTESLGAVGLALPDSTEGFYKLMTTLDGTTAAGQAQIAALLNNQDAASEYYDLLEDYTDKLTDLSKSIASTIAGFYGVSDAVSAMSLDSAVAAARIGDFSEALNLDLSAYNLNESDFSSAVAFNSAQASAANKLLEIAQLSDSVTGASSLDDLMLSANQSQVEILTSINDTLAGSYVPTTTTASSNDDLVIELQSIKAELAEIKIASKVTAEKSTDIRDDTRFIRRGDGINVVVV